MNESTSIDRPQQSTPHASWLATLAAPLRAIIQPQTAARQLVSAPAWSYWPAYLLHLGLFTATLLLAALFDDSVKLVHAGLTPQGNVDLGLHYRSLAEVWRIWHADATFTPAEGILLILPLSLTLAHIVLIWLNVVRVHRAGSFRRSYAQAFRAVSSAGGMVWLAIASLALMWSLWHHADLREAAAVDHRPGYFIFAPWEEWTFLLTPVCGCLVLWWIGRAVSGVRNPQPVMSPRCENCGYDLSHAAADGVCPECGTAVAASLNPSTRPGSSWERSRSPLSWLRTLTAVLCRPSRAYRRVRARETHSSAYRFAAWNYVVLWGAVYLGIAAVDSADDLLWRGHPIADVLQELLEDAPWMLAGATAIGVVGSLAHRAVTSIVVTWWLLRRHFDDYAAAAKIVAYESAYLWVVFAFLLPTAVVFEFFDEYVKYFPGLDELTSVTPLDEEEFINTAGVAVLVLVQMWRMRRARLVTRWSNF